MVLKPPAGPEPLKTARTSDAVTTTEVISFDAGGITETVQPSTDRSRERQSKKDGRQARQRGYESQAQALLWDRPQSAKQGAKPEVIYRPHIAMTGSCFRRVGDATPKVPSLAGRVNAEPRKPGPFPKSHRSGSACPARFAGRAAFVRPEPLGAVTLCPANFAPAAGRGLDAGL